MNYKKFNDVITKNKTLPILEHVFVQGNYVWATDLDNQYTLPNKDNLPGGVYKLVDGELYINKKYSIDNVPTPTPYIGQKIKDTYFKVDKEDIKLLLDCVSGDETRLAVTGIHLSNHKGRLCFVATDCRQLTFIEIAKEVENLPKNIIIPFNKFSKFIKTDKTNCIEIYENHVLLNGEFLTRTIKAVYPNYEEVIPNVMGLEIFSFNRKELLKTLKKIKKVNKAFEVKDWIGLYINRNEIINESEHNFKVEFSTQTASYNNNKIITLLCGIAKEYLEKTKNTDANIVLDINRFIKILDGYKEDRLNFGISSKKDLPMLYIL